MIKHVRSVVVLLFMFVLFLGLSLSSQADELLKWDFEGKELNGWGPRGDNVSLEIVSEEAYKGDYSLLTKGRNSDWNGPSINLQTLVKNGKYSISVWVKLPEGHNVEELIMTIEKSEGSNTSWDRVVGPVAVGAEEWVELQGDYRFTDAFDIYTLYIESPNINLAYYIDEIKITPLELDDIGSEEDLGIQTEEVFTWDFQNKEMDGWGPRGDNVSLEIVSEEAYKGDYSLLTKGRNSDWNGPSISIQDYLITGEKYNISAWVRLPEGQNEDELIMTIEKNDGETDSWDRVAGPIKVDDSNWVELSGDYTINSGYERFTLYIESPDEILEYYIDNITISMVGKIKKEIEGDIKSLAELYKNNFLIGTAVEPYQLSGEHSRLLIKHFNCITAENVMKPQSLQPEEDNFTFGATDKLVSFAEENGIQLRGHTLLWHQQSPGWFFIPSAGGELRREELLERLKKHIQTIVGRYKGRVYAWDVVNEVIDPSSRDTNGLRKNMWYQYLGPEYIEKAFKYAHEADPEAKLFINDYSLVSDSNKREYMYNLVKSLREKGIPVDGIGMQVHINIYDPRIMEIEETIEKFASLGVELHITELDMSVYRQDIESYDKAPEELLLRQGHRYKELFDLFKKYSDNIGNVTFWGMADDHTWLTSHPVERNNWPLLFDENLKAKYAYWGLVDSAKLPDLSNEEIREAYSTEAVKGTAKIDGIYDQIWDSANELTTDVLVAGNAGARAKVRTMWDEKNLYIYAEVSDPVLGKDNPNTYEQDSVEIFIDENNHKSYSYEEDDSQYRVNYANEQSFDPNPEREGFITATRVTDTGYVVEAAIELLTIKPEIGQSIGFDFQVNDDQGTGSRASIVMWNDPSGNSWQDTSGLGNLLFVE